jgi:hypothetical protein
MFSVSRDRVHLLASSAPININKDFFAQNILAHDLSRKTCNSLGIHSAEDLLHIIENKPDTFKESEKHYSPFYPF